MIGRLAGRIIDRGLDQVMIDVGGVGYVVHCSERTLATLPGKGEAAALYTDLLVREDLLQLFGFATLAEKEWHRTLTSVQGVGAKASLAILGALGADGVGRAIALGDSAALRAAPGVGPKLALRIANELKDKAPALMALVDTAPEPAPVAASPGDATPAPAAKAAPAPAPKPNASAQSEALSALGNLGYAPTEAARAVAEAAGQNPEAETPALIRAALRLLAPAG